MLKTNPVTEDEMKEWLTYAAEELDEEEELMVVQELQ